MKEKDNFTFFDWYQMILTYISDNYECRVRLPVDINERSFKDGLTLVFYNINWECFITTYHLHAMFDMAYNRHEALNDFKDLIVNKLEDQIFKENRAKPKKYKKIFKNT